MTVKKYQVALKEAVRTFIWESVGCQNCPATPCPATRNQRSRKCYESIVAALVKQSKQGE